MSILSPQKGLVGYIPKFVFKKVKHCIIQVLFPFGLLHIACYFPTFTLYTIYDKVAVGEEENSKTY